MTQFNAEDNVTATFNFGKGLLPPFIALRLAQVQKSSDMEELCQKKSEQHLKINTRGLCQRQRLCERSGDPMWFVLWRKTFSWLMILCDLKLLFAKYLHEMPFHYVLHFLFYE